MTVWLAAPWRCASRLVLRFSLATVGRAQPMRLVGVVAAAAVVVAVVQAVQARQWAVALVLSSVAAAGVICPLADAAVSRRSEYAADELAGSHGLGQQLAAALQMLTRGGQRRAGRVARLLSRHPDLDSQLEALAEAPRVQAAP